MAITRGAEVDQLPREARQHQARIADHGQQHLAQGFRLRGLQGMRSGGHRREPDVAEMREFARQGTDLRPEMQLDVVQLRRCRGERRLRHECGREHGVFGERCDDRRGFRGLIDNVARHTPALEPKSVRVD